VSGRPDDELPSWRERLKPWLMALVRLGAGWLVAAQPLALLIAEPALFRVGAAGPVRLAAAAALGVGIAVFAWPRTYGYGLALLLVGLAAFEWLWRGLGLPPTPRLPSSVAVLAVLAAGEWLTQRVGRRR
jgi:hypothetical protein